MRKSVISLLAAAALLVPAGIAIAQAQEEQLAPPKVTFLTAEHEVPFELFRGNRVIAPGKLNGHSTPMILDTGASATTVDKAFARSIGLPEGRKVEARGAGGVVEAEIVPNVTLEIGGMRFENMTVAVMDLAPVANLIPAPPIFPPPPVPFNTLGEADAVETLGISLYADLQWSSELSSAIGYSFTEVDNTNFQDPTAFHKGEYASVNLLWQPDPHLLGGMELLWGRRTDNDGAQGDDVRLQTSFKFSFSSKDIWGD